MGLHVFMTFGVLLLGSVAAAAGVSHVKLDPGKRPEINACSKFLMNRGQPKEDRCGTERPVPKARPGGGQAWTCVVWQNSG